MYGYVPFKSTEDIVCDKIKAVVSESPKWKSFRSSANPVQNAAIWSSTSVKGLTIVLSGRSPIRSLSCFEEQTTYHQSYVVCNLEWIPRIWSFASECFPWYLEEQGYFSARRQKQRTSRYSPSLWRDLVSSHSGLVALVPPDRIDVYEKRTRIIKLTYLHSGGKYLPR